jgi:hypothetical protein
MVLEKLVIITSAVVTAICPVRRKTTVKSDTRIMALNVTDFKRERLTWAWVFILESIS